jgi:hypothetical protein
VSKRKPKAIEPDEQAPARSRRLNLRLTEVEYDMLTELRLALHQSSDAATVRTLLRLHHTHARRAVNDLHRRVERSDDLQDALEARQLRLFRRGES